MIFYSHCKINLGLSVLARREDGFSDIESVMFDVGDSLCDMVEVVPSARFLYSASGIALDCPTEANLCVKAYRMMQQQFDLPPVAIHLHKNIPFGAGLGAGSANAVAVIELCQRLFALDLSDDKKEELAARIGSDTAFFVRAGAAVVRGRGEILEPITVDLRGYYILLVKPDVGVSTKEAYGLVTPCRAAILPSRAVSYPIEQWSRVLVNDFERPIFDKLPVLELIKGELYRAGALYASMSGSGSTIFGIFDSPPTLRFNHFSHLTKID